MIAIDPGSERSAMLWYHPEQPADSIGPSMLVGNAAVLDELRTSPCPQPLVIEMVASFGMPVGREVFETVRWIGQFTEAWASRGGTVEYVYRKDIKLALCGTARAKDSNVRQALIDRFGGPAAIKKGGPLHGITKDLWSALAVAVAWSDLGVRENSSTRRAGLDLVSGRKSMNASTWLVSAATALDLDPPALQRALDWSNRSGTNVRTRERIVVWLHRNATKQMPLTTREIGDILGGDQASVSKAYKRARERAKKGQP